MSLVDQFDSLSGRRNYLRSFDTKKQKYPNASVTLAGFYKLGHSLCDNSFEQKSNLSPKKHTVDKFQQLRKRLASRTNMRSKKIAMKSTANDFFQSNQFSGSNTLQLISCSKAIVHPDQKAHQVMYRKTRRDSGCEQLSKNIKKESYAINFLRPSRRFSQQVSKNDTTNRVSDSNQQTLNAIFQITDNVSDLVFKSSGFGNQSYRVKMSIGRQSSNKTSRTKETRNSENDFSTYKIDGWELGVGDNEGLVF